MAVAVWTPWIAGHFGDIRQTHNAVLWVIAVFGSWMVMLVPLIIFMYAKVDKAYEDARLAREKAQLHFRSILVEKSKRLLPRHLSHRLKGLPEVLEGGHLVSLTLKDGKHFPHVFIQNGEEILGIYGASEMTFRGDEVIAVEPEDPKELARSTASNWLRLDGAGPPR